MRVGMLRALLGALAVIAMMSMVIVRTFRLGSRDRQLDILSGGKCLNYMEHCVPWESYCCDDMSCTNFAKGFCMYGFEPCICQLPFIAHPS